MSVSTDTATKNSSRSLRFTQHGDFQKTLNERVNAYLHDHHIHGRDVPAMYVKSAVILAWWSGTYLLLLLGHFPVLANLALCLVWALAIASVGFNVMHDANHSGYSNHPMVNKVISYSAEMLGISGFRWRVKHNVWHHTYTNIGGFDADIETFGTMRLTPREKWKPLFQGQAWYFPIVYSLITFDLIGRDFLMIFTGKSDANHSYPKMNAEDKIAFWVGKLFYFVIMFGLPLLVFPWWQVLIGFMLINLTVGLVMGIVFQLAHINGNTEFPVPVGTPEHIENEWAVHQVETTTDFAPRNWLLNFYIGGLNYQIEHHLLTHICHLNYPRLAPIVRATCEEYGIHYNVFPTWREAFVSHWRELRLLGRRPNLTQG